MPNRGSASSRGSSSAGDRSLLPLDRPRVNPTPTVESTQDLAGSCRTVPDSSAQDPRIVGPRFSRHGTCTPLRVLIARKEGGMATGGYRTFAIAVALGLLLGAGHVPGAEGAGQRVGGRKGARRV